jgi:hypothetical protein
MTSVVHITGFPTISPNPISPTEENLFRYNILCPGIIAMKRSREGCGPLKGIAAPGKVTSAPEGQVPSDHQAGPIWPMYTSVLLQYSF